MHEHGLAKELWPQLQGIAETNGLKRVTRVEMLVGELHGVSAEFLAHSFEHAFEGSNFRGAEVKITLVEPGGKYVSPGQEGPTTASGWEILVMRMEGET